MVNLHSAGRTGKAQCPLEQFPIDERWPWNSTAVVVDEDRRVAGEDVVGVGVGDGEVVCRVEPRGAPVDVHSGGCPPSQGIRPMRQRCACYLAATRSRASSRKAQAAAASCSARATCSAPRSVTSPTLKLTMRCARPVATLIIGTSPRHRRMMIRISGARSTRVSISGSAAWGSSSVNSMRLLRDIQVLPLFVTAWALGRLTRPPLHARFGGHVLVYRTGDHS